MSGKVAFEIDFEKEVPRQLEQSHFPSMSAHFTFQSRLVDRRLSRDFNATLFTSLEYN